MFGRRCCLAIFVFFLVTRVGAQIELLSFHQDLNPHRATLTLAIESPDTQLKTNLSLEYPGYCGTIGADRKEKILLSNSRGSIAAINFWSGSKINDSVAIALLPNGAVAYFPRFNHVVAEKLADFKGKLEESLFRITAVADNGIQLEYNDHSPEGLLFHVLARISEDGKVEIRREDIKD